MSESRLIGIAGLPRSGKDTVAEILLANGWFGISFGDVIRQYAKRRHRNEVDPISILNMTETANWLRQTRGSDVVLRLALRQFNHQSVIGKKYKGLVLWSVRAPVEVDFILAHDGELIWVEADDVVRYKRAMANMRDGEQKISLIEFNRQEALQWQPQPGLPIEVQMDVSYVKQHATKIINNNSDNLDNFIKYASQLIDTKHF